jgi:hypothetical protein
MLLEGVSSDRGQVRSVPPGGVRAAEAIRSCVLSAFGIKVRLWLSRQRAALNLLKALFFIFADIAKHTTPKGITRQHRSGKLGSNLTGLVLLADAAVAPFFLFLRSIFIHNS